MKDNTTQLGQAKTQSGLQSSSPKEIFSAYAALFASVGTLVCCALPASLVLVGFGLASVLTFFTAIPGWQKAALYTPWFFLGGGILLATGFYFSYFHRRQPEGEVCEIPVGSKESACSTATLWNRRILWLSLLLYGLAATMDTLGIGWMRAHGYFNR